jgi:hypothetical protein
MTVIGCRGCAFEPEDSKAFPCHHPDAKYSWFHQQGSVRKTCYYDYKLYSGRKKKICCGESHDAHMREEGVKQVLDKIERWARKATKESKDEFGQIPFSWVISEIESLRKPEAQPQQKEVEG